MTAPARPPGRPVHIVRREAWARGSGINAWIWQRVTAVALIVLLGGHMWWNHYADLVYPADHYITFLGVKQRLVHLPGLAFNTLLLAATLFHGLNGVRNVIFDYGLSSRARRAVTLTLLALGLTFFAYGSIGRMNFYRLQDARADRAGLESVFAARTPAVVGTP